MSIAVLRHRPLRAVALVVAITAAGTVASPPPAAAAIVPSNFTQLAGDAACTIQAPVLVPGSQPADPATQSPCREGRALEQAEAVTVSADGLNVYVASSGIPTAGSNAVAVFTRDAATGRLEQHSCISADGGDGRAGSDGSCTDGDALLGANAVALSPDGRFAYVTASSSNGLAAFKRDPATGALEQIGCHKSGPRGDRCLGALLDGARGAVVTPDGKWVYVLAAAADAVSIFSRDSDTGLLTYTGCMSSSGSDGACSKGTALRGPTGIASAADGRTIWVTARYAGVVASYERDADTGRLTPKACALAAPPAGSKCAAVPSLLYAADVAIAPDGAHAYVTSAEGIISTLAIDQATGAMTRTSCLVDAPPAGDDVVVHEDEEEFEDDEELPEEEEDVDEDEEDEDFEDDAEVVDTPPAAAAGCAPARAIEAPDAIAISADGRSMFVVSRYGSAMASFSRDPATGALTQTGCVEQYPTYKSCAKGVGLYGPTGIAASPDGRSLYVAGRTSNAVAAFGAAVAVAPTATASKVTARAASVTVALRCPRVLTGCAGRLAPSGVRKGTWYALRGGQARRVTVRVPRTKLRAIRGRRAKRTALAATDARRIVRAARQRVTVR